MNVTYIVIGVLILGIAGYWFTTQTSEEQPAVETEEVAEEEVATDETETEATEEEVVAEPVDSSETAAVEEETADEAPAPAEVITETEEVVEEPATETPAAVTFDLTGNNYSFSESELRVKEGTEVTINFTSTGGCHDWVVDEFAAATDKVSAGGSTSVTFVADRTGSFEYYCSVGSHRAQGMVGTLIVE